MPDAALLRAIFGAAQCALVVIGANGRIEAASTAIFRLFGYAEGELLGREIGLLIDARDTPAPDVGPGPRTVPAFQPPAPLGVVNPPILAGGPESGQRRGARRASGVRRNGTRFPVEVTVSDVADPPATVAAAGAPASARAGQPRGEAGSGDPPPDDSQGNDLPGNEPPGNEPERRRILMSVRDLTEHDATQARLRELQEDLLHVSRLRAMGQMAAALSHELNQPLTATTNYLNAAIRIIDQREPDVARLRQAVSLAAQQTMRSGEIIRRLRAFVARGEVVRRAESIGRIVEEAGALALVDAKVQGVAFALEARTDLPLVLVDRVQIQQVLLNLVRNAVEAMEGMAERVMSVDAALWDSMVVVSVCDSGSGIPPAIEAQLFQPFVTTKRDGMGIGLSVCRTIVEAHGGRLWAEGRPGGGTVFRFTVPLASPEAGAASLD